MNGLSLSQGLDIELPCLAPGRGDFGTRGPERCGIVSRGWQPIWVEAARNIDRTLDLREVGKRACERRIAGDHTRASIWSTATPLIR